MVIINSFYLLEDEEKNSYQLTEVCKSIIKENAVVTAAKREAKAKKAREKKRNWADMPRDILALIFMKLGPMGILYRAQSVCSSWRKLSKEPSLFRSINMCKNEWEFLFRSLQLNINSYGAGDYIEVRKIAQVAVDRSCGQLAELFLDNFCTDEILHYALERSNFLKRLRLTPSYFFGFPNDLFNVLTKRVSFLEELDLCGLYSIDVFKQLCGLCSQLKCLRLDSTSNPLLDEVAVGIADTTPQLLRLQLSGTTLLTDIGLQALLDGCCYLEILDLGQCVYTNIGEELQKKCEERIKCFVLPAVMVLPVPDNITGGEYNTGWPACGCSCYCCCRCGEPEDEDLPDDEDDSVFLPKKLATCYL